MSYFMFFKAMNNWFYRAIQKFPLYLISIFLFFLRCTWARCLLTMPQWWQTLLAHQLWYLLVLVLWPFCSVTIVHLAPFLPSPMSKLLLITLLYSFCSDQLFNKSLNIFVWLFDICFCSERVRQRLALYQGVRPIYMNFFDNAEKSFSEALSYLVVTWLSLH